MSTRSLCWTCSTRLSGERSVLALCACEKTENVGGQTGGRTDQGLGLQGMGTPVNVNELGACFAGND